MGRSDTAFNAVIALGLIIQMLLLGLVIGAAIRVQNRLARISIACVAVALAFGAIATSLVLLSGLDIKAHDKGLGFVDSAYVAPVILSFWCCFFVVRRFHDGLIQSRRESIRGKCPACGYDLTANVSGRCPECGRRVLCDGDAAMMERMAADSGHGGVPKPHADD